MQRDRELSDPLQPDACPAHFWLLPDAYVWLCNPLSAPNNMLSLEVARPTGRPFGANNPESAEEANGDQIQPGAIPKR